MPVMPSLQSGNAVKPTSTHSTSTSPPVPLFSLRSSASASLYPPTAAKAENGSQPQSPTPSSDLQSNPPPLLQQMSLGLSNLLPPSIPRANSLTSGPSSSQPSNSAPLLARQLTTSRPPPLLQVPSIPGPNSDWRSNVTIEERLSQRTAIHEAYTRHCPSYAALLETVVAVEEELVFAAAAGRLDYLRSGIDWEGRLRMKKSQLGLEKSSGDKEEDGGEDGVGEKRSREDKGGAEDGSGSGSKNGTMDVSADEKTAKQDEEHEGVKTKKRRS